MIPFRPSRILVEPGAERFPLWARIRAAFPDAPVHAQWDRETRNDLKAAVRRGTPVRDLDPRDRASGVYLIAGENCPFSCAYCFLRGFHRRAALTLFTNQEEVIERLGAWLAEHPKAAVNAGHVSDALAMEEVTGLAAALAAPFAGFPGARLEIRTKAAFVPGPVPPNVTVAWTLNPPGIARLFENGAPSVEARLNAASEAASRGIPVGVRIDPVIMHGDWERAYADLADEILDRIRPLKDAEIGCLRVPPRLERALGLADPPSALTLGERVRAPDGRTVYLRPHRLRAYKLLSSRLEKAGISPIICGESRRGVPVRRCLRS